MSLSQKLSYLLTACVGAVSLTACGGGGSAAPATPPATPPTNVAGGSCARPASVPAMVFTCTGPTAPNGGVAATQTDIDNIVGDYSTATKILFVNFAGKAFGGPGGNTGFDVVAACTLGADVYLTYGTGSRMIFTQTAGVWAVNGQLPATATGASYTNQTKVSCNF